MSRLAEGTSVRWVAGAAIALGGALGVACGGDDEPLARPSLDASHGAADATVHDAVVELGVDSTVDVSVDARVDTTIADTLTIHVDSATPDAGGETFVPPSDAPTMDGVAVVDGAVDAGGDVGDDVLVVIDECGTPLTTDNLAVCNVVIQSWNDEGHLHYPIGTDIHYCTNPPNSGPHYPIWPAYMTWTTPLPQPFLMHAMEHGSVELRYNCPSGCADVVAQLQAIIDAQPDDPICDVEAGVRTRMILIPDPDLDVPIAASAWSWT
ncbi:MAG: DUF3105 domain-containing protein, partial [Polyangiales bacterium]